MVEFAAEIDVNAPASSVWALLVDPRRESEWMRAVKEVSFVAPAHGYAAGARMRRSGGFAGIKLSWESEIAACEPDRLIVFRHVGGALSGESRWELAPTPNGCRVRLSSRGPAPKGLAWFPALAALIGRAGLKGDLSRLKRLAEARGGRRSSG